MTSLGKYALRVVLCGILLGIFPFVYAESVTYTVISRTEVREDGIAPIGSQAVYEQSGTTGTYGQMTAGNYTRLTLHGYGDMRLRRLTLTMRSNTKSGAGSLEVRIGSETVLSLPPLSFSAPEWNGAFATQYVPCLYTFDTPLIVAKEDDIVITITATENSLYLQSCEVQYTLASADGYTVHFSTGIGQSLPSVKETEPDEGIILPDFEGEADGFHFIGWTELPVYETDAQPSFMQAGSRYYPSADMTLYALYTDADPIAFSIRQDTIFQSGYYLIADPYWACMAVSDVQSRRYLQTAPVNLSVGEDGLWIYDRDDLPLAALYELTFFPDSMVTLRHYQSGHFIGYSHTTAAALTNDSVLWNYTVLPDKQIAFYHIFEGKRRELRAQWGTTLETADSLWYVNTLYAFSVYANLLFPVDELLQNTGTLSPRYTSFPMGTALPMLPERETTLQMTADCLRNPLGKRLTVWSPAGLLLRVTDTDIWYDTLPRGVSIVRASDETCLILH